MVSALEPTLVTIVMLAPYSQPDHETCLGSNIAPCLVYLGRCYQRCGTATKEESPIQNVCGTCQLAEGPKRIKLVEEKAHGLGRWLICFPGSEASSLMN